MQRDGVEYNKMVVAFAHHSRDVVAMQGWSLWCAWCFRRAAIVTIIALTRLLNFDFQFNIAKLLCAP